MISIKEFEKFIEIDVNEMDKYKFKVGERFLIGESVIEQKHLKKEGDGIAFYEVSDINNKNIKYVVKYDKLGR